MQKETEKFGREAFAKIKATFASNLDENDIILDWCFASVHTMLQVMTISQAKSFARKVKNYVQQRKTYASSGRDIGSTVGESHQDLEMVKYQEQIDSTLEKIRAVIVEKTLESDQLIDKCGNMLRQSRNELSKFKYQLQHLDINHISLDSVTSSPSKVQREKRAETVEDEQ